MLAVLAVFNTLGLIALAFFMVELRRKLMTQVQVSQEQIDALNASIKKQGDVVALLKADSGLMLGLVVDLRKALADALANGQPLQTVDLTAAIASIDSVTAELSKETTDDEAILNPPAPTVGTPQAPAAGTDLPDGLPNGQVAPAPGVAPQPAPNPGDPAGVTGLDDGHGSVTAGTLDGADVEVDTSHTAVDTPDVDPAHAPDPSAAAGLVADTGKGNDTTGTD